MKINIGRFLIVAIGILGTYALSILTLNYVENILLIEAGGLILASIILVALIIMVIVIMLVREDEVYEARREDRTRKSLKNISLHRTIVAIRMENRVVDGVKLITGEYVDVLEVIDRIKDGEAFIVKAKNGDISKVEIYNDRFIRTKADQQKADNLLNLPRI